MDYEREIARLEHLQKVQRTVFWVGMGIAAVGILLAGMSLVGVGAHTMITIRI